MKKKLFICLLLLCLIVGCGKKEYAYPGRESINDYMKTVLDITESLNNNLEPDILKWFMRVFEAQWADKELKLLKEAMSENGVIIDKNFTDNIPINNLSTICQGDASLYIDEQLIYVYTTSKKEGNSYSCLSNELVKRVWDFILPATWSPDSIRGKRLRINFYIDEEDWDDVVKDKDPFKYLAIEVKITDN